MRQKVEKLQWMSPERHAAQQKQIARGNAPWQTRENMKQVYRDFTYPITGPYYRKRLNDRPKRKR